jgi:hypothetical protein
MREPKEGDATGNRNDCPSPRLNKAEGQPIKETGEYGEAREQAEGDPSEVSQFHAEHRALKEVSVVRAGDA